MYAIPQTSHVLVVSGPFLPDGPLVEVHPTPEARDDAVALAWVLLHRRRFGWAPGGWGDPARAERRLEDEGWTVQRLDLPMVTPAELRERWVEAVAASASTTAGTVPLKPPSAAG